MSPSDLADRHAGRVKGNGVSPSHGRRGISASVHAAMEGHPDALCSRSPEREDGQGDLLPGTLIRLPDGGAYRASNVSCAESG